MYLGVAQMMWPMWGMGGMMWFWVFLIIAGYWFWWYGPRYIQRRRYWNRLDPLDQARARLARGELSLEEFEEIKKAIQNR